VIIGRGIGLERCIHPNPAQNGKVSDSLVADTVEAIIGAAFLERGIQAVEHVMEKLGVLEMPVE
jgi:ribonuclease-3